MEILALGADVLFTQKLDIIKFLMDIFEQYKSNQESRQFLCLTKLLGFLSSKDNLADYLENCETKLFEQFVLTIINFDSITVTR